MQIVIDMPDENYEVLLTKIMLACSGCKITELVKRHGKLVDIEQAKKFLYEEIERLHDDEFYDCFSRIIDDMYNELPTIIEADKESD